MARLVISPGKSLQGSLTVPGDKSVSHRALLLNSIARGTARVQHSLDSADVRSTRQALVDLGVSIQTRNGEIIIQSQGKAGLKPPAKPLDMGNSGTTTRLILGILAGQPFRTELFGDASLSKRPMARVTKLLEGMDAKIEWGKNGENFLPLTITGKEKLNAVDYTMSIPSAQVKSALLLAGLYANRSMHITEKIPTRDHTERMLAYLGANIRRDGLTITIDPSALLTARDIIVPGDISSAAFFLVAGTIVPDSSILIQGVGLNPTRTGLLEVLREMGASISAQVTAQPDWEPIGEISVKHQSSLKAVRVPPTMSARIIDELPILMVAATQAQGTTILEGAGELKVKETDRIQSMVTGLTAMGARLRVEQETIFIEGPTKLKGAQVDSFTDHRTAMALAVAGLIAQGPTTIEGSEWIDISFPSFAQDLERIRR